MVDADGLSALRIAAYVQQVPVLQVIVDSGDRTQAKEAFADGVERGFAEPVRVLLQAGVPPTVRSADGVYPHAHLGGGQRPFAHGQAVVGAWGAS